jgi:hypothetical protein
MVPIALNPVNTGNIFIYSRKPMTTISLQVLPVMHVAIFVESV